MNMHSDAPNPGENAAVEPDLGPLAWVLDELRKSLDGAVKALKRFVRDAELALGSDLGSLDASQLRIARQQLHQAVGALEMVGLEVPAKVLRATESLAQKFVQRPETCSVAAATTIERASFALTDYLEGLLKGKTLSSVALFPQYRDVLELLETDRIHPADLWSQEWRWQDVNVPDNVTPIAYEFAGRSRFDSYVLNIVKSSHGRSARALAEISWGLAAGQTPLQPRVFWAIAAAYFETLALGLCGVDVYTKRSASRVLSQLRTLSRGETEISERLVQDLLFFCAQARPGVAQLAPALRAVRLAYGLDRYEPVNYSQPQLGRYDPAALVQARKRIAAATETWSALSGGDVTRIKAASDQFSLVADSIVKLHPDSKKLSAALTRAMDTVNRSGKAPAPALAMEVATSVLYLEAAYDDMDLNSEEMVERSHRLAQRLELVIEGALSEPLDSWMEELYRRVSDRQIMGSVVDELRVTLSEVESALDTFFRNPQEALPLHEVPGMLAQMRGVFSVLGLDQAAVAALRMRDQVEHCMVADAAALADHADVFEKLGSSLGAMGFLIDMLSYQRELAKRLFVYDEVLGEFRSLMGRRKQSTGTTQQAELSAEAGVVPSTRASLLAPLETPVVLVSAPVPVAVPAVAGLDVTDEDDDAELRDVFLQEADEVVRAGLDAVMALHNEPGDLEKQTALRRAFHTLKGSSRMVGLNEFGEAAWAMEQLFNAWLPQQKPASIEMIRLSGQAVSGLSEWLHDVGLGHDAVWSSMPFRQAADELRLHDVALDLTDMLSSLDTEPPSYVQDPAPASALLDVETTPEAVDTVPLDEEQFTTVMSLDDELPKIPTLSDFKASAGLMDAEFPAELMPEPEAAATDRLETGSGDFESTASAGFDNTQMLATWITAEAPLAPAVAVPGSGAELSEVVEQPLQALSPADLEPTPLAEPQPVEVDEQVKVIGDLRIGIALYNVYLNEADEWSRRLLTELTEWSIELDRPLPDLVVNLAHSLAGSSATVGFTTLSELARALEHSAEHVQLAGVSLKPHADLFVAVAEDMRRLLHQFAAGFLKEPDSDHLPALRDVLDIEVSSRAVPFDDTDLELVDDSDPESVDLSEIELSFDDLVPEIQETAELPELPVEEPIPELVTLEPEAEPEPASLAVEVQDMLDVDLFPIFEEEALELLPQLSSALRQWSARPDNLGARQEALRILHTLKGSARLAGAMRLGEMAHQLESSIERVDASDANAPLVTSLLVPLDEISAVFEALRKTPVQALSLPESVPLVEDLEAPESELSELSELTQSAVLVSPAPFIAALAPVVPQRRSASQNIRVRSQLVDRMVNQAGEVMITRSRLEARLGQMRGSLDELTGNLDRLHRQLRDLELQSESQMQSRLAQTKDIATSFDPLEFDRFTRVQELTRMMAESVHDVATVQRSMQQTVAGVEDDLIAQARQTRELQRDLLRTRMVEFDSISERLHGVVRQAAKDSGKHALLEIVGGSLEMDRGVLERVAPAFEHLLRNAVAHGIETAQQREALSKPAAGTIRINLAQQSNDVVASVEDDGAGLNLPGIQQKALEQGLISADAKLTDAQVSQLIFATGLSTASSISELAGRGIGMDVVRAEVNALGGHIDLSSQPGVGTQVRLVVPLTTAVTQVVLLRMGELVMGVPAGLVELVRRLPKAELAEAYRSNSLTYAGESVPFYWAGALLQTSVQSAEVPGKTASVAIFRSAGQRVAIHLDEVLGHQEAVVKNLGPQLSKLPGLAGMTVLASGAVVLIYNPVALAITYGDQALSLRAAVQSGEPLTALDALVAAPAASVPQVPLVLVVDDSITVRRVTQRLLKREGFRVVLAADGLQALEVLQLEKPSVVLTDIEMPRMDGFDLVRNIRGDAKLMDLPIIMITSRIAEKHRDYARELKVNNYLGKPYPEDELIALVRQYCGLDVVA
jgi:chemosensory pili system protein ChpA (sensor histidine kinase/response regulator)